MPVHNFRFTNPPDGTAEPKGLARIGPVLPVEVTIPSSLAEYLLKNNLPIPPPVPGFALIDTGATGSGVDEEVVKRLGVNPIGITTVMGVAGQVRQNLYPAKFIFPIGKFEIEFTSLIGINLKGQSVGDHSLIVLVGRDVLSRFLFIYNGPDAHFTFAF